MVRSPYTPGIARSVRANLMPNLAHSYEATPVALAPPDLWSRREKETGEPERRACRYVPRTGLVLTGAGYVVATDPPITGAVAYLQTLTTPADDPLADGDVVRDIRDNEGVLLLAGPAVVQSVMAHAGYGPTTLRMFVLRGDVRERTP